MRRSTKRSGSFDRRNRIPIEIPLGSGVGMEPGARAYRLGHCTIILGRTPRGRKYHMSIAHPSRYPTWDEVSDARYALIPDNVTVAMILPPSGEYINLHSNCFHLWEVGPVDKS